MFREFCELMWCILRTPWEYWTGFVFLSLQNALKADVEKYGGKIANGVHEGNIFLTSFQRVVYDVSVILQLYLVAYNVIM